MIGVNPLPREEALNSGVTVVSEIIVFVVGGTILVYEYKVSSANDARKASIAAKEKSDAKQALDDRFEVMETKILVLADKIQTLETSIAAQSEQNQVCSETLIYCANYSRTHQLSLISFSLSFPSRRAEYHVKITEASWRWRCFEYS